MLLGTIIDAMSLPSSSRIVAGIALVLLGATFVLVVLRLSAASDGVRVEFGDLNSIYQPDGLVIVPYQSTSPFKRNDIVIAVAGHSMQEWANRMFDATLIGPTWRQGNIVEYTVRRGEQRVTVPITLGDFPFAAWFTEYWVNVFAALMIFGIGVYVFARRPAERAAQLLFLTTTALFALVVAQWLSLSIQEFIEGVPYLIPRIYIFVLYHMMWSTLLWFILIFPKPQPWLARTHWVIPFIYLIPFAIFIFYLCESFFTESNRILWHGDWVLASDRIALGYGISCVVALVSGYFYARRNPITRLQARWAISGFVLSLVLIVALNMLPKNILGAPIVDRRALGVLLLPIPLGLGVAILRYRLFDIDRLINRALVYGALTAFVVIVYIAIVGYFGSLLQTTNEAHTRADLLLSLLATGVIALLFQPLRERIQRGVNHLLYGERDEPYAVIARLGQRLEAALVPDAVMPTLVEIVAHALKLPYVAVKLKQGDEFSLLAESAPSVSPSALISFPLVHQHETIGELVVAPRAGDEALDDADRHLLETIANQAALAAHGVRLTADLQRSRERLVTAREEERRRIRRDLHDGLGPALASITLKLDAARNQLPPNAQTSDALLRESKTQTQNALSDIRRLVYALRPPALDELGLVGALREYTTRATSPDLTVSLVADEDLPALPAAVEVAAYRIATEAVTNVSRHAHAHNCQVVLALNGALQLEIQDDGVGLPKEYHAGVGLTSMRERAAELGGTLVIETVAEGGTRVVAELPITKDEG